MSRQDNNEPTDQMLLENNENMTVKLEDKYFLTHILFYALGTLTLVPKDFFITANDYWMYKFRDPNEVFNSSSKSNRTGMQAQFASSFTIVSNVTSIAALVLTMILAKKISIKTRLFGALTSMIVLFLITLIFVEINTDSWQKGFFVITLITGALLNATGSVFTVTTFQLVSKFPPSFLGAQLSGQAICGIFAAMVQICCLAIGFSSQGNALVYFSIGAFCVAFTLIYYVTVLKYSDFFVYNYNKKVEEAEMRFSKEQMKVVLNKIKYLLLTMIVVLGSTIMIHPGVTSLVESVGRGTKWNDVFFVPVATFLLFNLFDFIGRELASKIGRPKSGLIMFIIGILRISFVPMLMYCNVQPRHHLPLTFNSDTVYMVFVVIFSFSNGYLVNNCVIRIPMVTEKEEKNISMLLIIVFMIVSMATCSFLSVVVINAV